MAQGTIGYVKRILVAPGRPVVYELHNTRENRDMFAVMEFKPGGMCVFGEIDESILAPEYTDAPVQEGTFVPHDSRPAAAEITEIPAEGQLPAQGSEHLAPADDAVTAALRGDGSEEVKEQPESAEKQLLGAGATLRPLGQDPTQV